MFKVFRLKCILLFPIVLSLASNISTANARGGIFLVKSNEDAVVDVNLLFSDGVVGNVSVSSGFIDFYVMNPSGVILQSFHNISVTTFNFIASENGNYSLHLNNTCQTCDVVVTLSYIVTLKRDAYQSIHVVPEARAAKVVQPTPKPDIDVEFDNSYKKLFNYLKAVEILRVIKDGCRYFPIRNIVLISIVILSLCLIYMMKRYNFHRAVDFSNISIHVFKE